jgi:glycosyltransferase involved in cell wall biosynthesis
VAEPLGRDESKNGGQHMSTPAISVIIPAYNYARYLPAALNSVSEQSFADWECIVVDDGSTDDTKIVVNDFISKHADQQFRYVYIPNSGTSVAKNTGINLARGKYIQFLDADDLLSREKLAIQFAIMESRDCALVFSKAVFFNDGQEEQEFASHYPEGFLAEATLANGALLAALVKNNVITISSPLVHKHLLVAAGNFQVDLKNNEDWLLWFRVALLKPIFIFDGDDRSYAKIRIHPNSAMRIQHNMFLGEVVVRKAIDAALHNHNALVDSHVLLRMNMDLLALHRVRSLEWSKGWAYILREFFKQPRQRAGLLSSGVFKSGVRMVRSFIPQNGT